MDDFFINLVHDILTLYLHIQSTHLLVSLSLILLIAAVLPFVVMFDLLIHFQRSVRSLLCCGFCLCDSVWSVFDIMGGLWRACTRSSLNTWAGLELVWLTSRVRLIQVKCSTINPAFLSLLCGTDPHSLASSDSTANMWLSCSVPHRILCPFTTSTYY